MKRILAFFLILLLAVLCSCSRIEDPLKPVSKEDISVHVFGIDRDVTLKRVDTSNPYALDLLTFAKKCLKENSIKGEITDIYHIPLNLATSTCHYDPYAIYYKGCSDDPVHMVILSDGDGFSYIGSFKKSDVIDSDYYTASAVVLTEFQGSILASLNLIDDNKEIHFPPDVLRNAAMGPITTEAKSLFEDVTNAYGNFYVYRWEYEMGAKLIDSKYIEVPKTGPQNFAELKEYIEKYFTERNSRFFYENLLMPENGAPAYIEADGKLYVSLAGKGGPHEYLGSEPILSGYKGDDTLYIIAEVKTTSGYKEELFTFIKEDGEWKCDRFLDLAYGMYSSGYFTADSRFQ